MATALAFDVNDGNDGTERRRDSRRRRTSQIVVFPFSIVDAFFVAFFFERLCSNTKHAESSSSIVKNRQPICAIEDEASGDDSRAATKPNVKKKRRGRKKRRPRVTHHTPTHEYVVPKSIPMAGPSDFADMIDSILSSFKVFFLSSCVFKISADLVFCEAFFFFENGGKKNDSSKTLNNCRGLLPF